MAPAFGLLAARLPADFSSFLDPLLFLQTEIPRVPPPRVLAAAHAERWLLESCAGTGMDRGKPKCCPALDEAWC